MCSLRDFLRDARRFAAACIGFRRNPTKISAIINTSSERLTVGEPVFLNGNMDGTSRKRINLLFFLYRSEMGIHNLLSAMQPGCAGL